MNRLVLIDGNSIFYRAFYALPLLKNDEGEFSNAIYGFANILIKVINDLKPTHIAVAFDVSKHTFRNDIYSDYKATRKPMPDEMKSQTNALRQMLDYMHIKCVEQKGVEADDILGTLAKRFDDDTIIVTGDRDCFQLIDKSTSVFFTKKGVNDIQMIDINEFQKQYDGLMPKSIIELKALQGDNSDNIPGVSGVGEKTARDLICKFGNVDNLYKNIDTLTGRLKEKIENGKQDCYMSKKLATIDTQVDIQCDLDDCLLTYPFDKNVYEFMKKYDFRSLIKRQDIFNNVDEFGEAIVNQLDVNKTVCDNIDEFDKLVVLINSCEKFSIFINGEVKLIGIENIEFEIITKDDLFNDGLTSEIFYAKLYEIITKNGKKVVFYDKKFAKKVFSAYGFDFKSIGDDVSILAHLVSGLSIKSISNVIDMFGGDDKYPASSLLLCEDILFKKLVELKMFDLYQKVELPLVDVLFDMEKNGFKVDGARLDDLGKKYSQRLLELENEIINLAGQNFNINSPKQLAEILYTKLELPHSKKQSTDIDALENLIGLHDIIPLIIEYRKLAKLNGTYIEGLKSHLDSQSKIHTNFKQTLTTTGRLSSTEPNLQNIPIRDEFSREIRSMFIASCESNVLVDVDYSQIELRLLAHLSGDDVFVEALKNGVDIHTQTACEVFGVDSNAVTHEMRRIAKVVNFGIIYGISEYGLAKDLGIKPYLAKEYITNYYIKHPKVAEFMKLAVDSAREVGRVESILGRSRRMVEITSSNGMIRARAERASQNMRLQGSAADVIKLAMIRVYKALEKSNLQAKLIMQVHDELIIDCPKNQSDKVVKIVEYEMQNAINLKVPLTVDVSISYRWNDGHGSN